MNDIQQKLREFKESLFVAAPVIIKEIKNYKTQRADVKLKNKHKKGKEPPKILDVPFSHDESKTFSERKLPEQGDVAWVVFTNRSIDKALENMEQSEPEHDRILDINDCYLAGEWSSDDKGIPKSIGSMKKDDWLIGLHRDEQSRIYMRKDSGNIVLEPPPGKKTLELTEDPAYHVALFEKIMEDYNTHTHTCPQGGITGFPSNPWTVEDDASKRVGVDN